MNCSPRRHVCPVCGGTKDPHRLLEIEERRAAIHAKELGDLQEVANGASVGGYVEEESSALTMFAVATRDIESGELLLFNADSVFRTTGAEFEPLNTTYVGWFFRPNRRITKGETI